jgi:hypothetical protein
MPYSFVSPMAWRLGFATGVDTTGLAMGLAETTDMEKGRRNDRNRLYSAVIGVKAMRKEAAERHQSHGGHFMLHRALSKFGIPFLL